MCRVRIEKADAKQLGSLAVRVGLKQPKPTISNCVSVGRRQKTAAFDAVFGVVPTP